jgi:hypothetical protein
VWLSQKMIIIIVTAVETSNLTRFLIVLEYSPVHVGLTSALSLRCGTVHAKTVLSAPRFDSC